MQPCAEPGLVNVSAISASFPRRKGKPRMSLEMPIGALDQITALLALVGFAGSVPAPAIERIIKHDTRLKLFEIVVVHSRKAQRGGKQAGGLGAEIEPVGIGSPHDGREPQ